MQKLPEAPDKKMCKKGTISIKERNLFSFSSDRQRDNTKNVSFY